MKILQLLHLGEVLGILEVKYLKDMDHGVGNRLYSFCPPDL